MTTYPKPKAEAQDFVMFPSHITLQNAMKLAVGDKIDHRDNIGYFAIATVLAKNGSKLKIHYDGYPNKYDRWCNIKFPFELCRFAPAGSISQRPSYQDHFRSLRVGDHVDILNPRLPGNGGGWKVGTILRFSKTRGQVRVEYSDLGGIEKRIWTHLDNDKEIAQYKTKQSHSHNTEWEPIDIVKALLWNSDGKSMQWIALKMGRTIDDVRKTIRKENKKKRKQRKRKRLENKTQNKEEESVDTIRFKIHHPPPKQDQKMGLVMCCKTQTFGSIIPPLEQKFGMKIMLRFDGEVIPNTWTPQMLIDEYDAEDGDLIDAHYSSR